MRTNFKIPHTFTIVFAIIVVCAVLTWIVPGGEFERQTVMVDGHARNVVVGDSYHHFSARVLDPDGRRRFADELVDKVVAYSEDSVESPGFWTLEFAKAEKPCYDVIGLDLTGITGLLFLSHRKTWSCVKGGCNP